MPLEEPGRIDIITKSENGGINLIITDAGITVEPQERFEKLRTKLANYVRYVGSEAFRTNHPGVSPETVSIQVISKNEPTEQMRQIEFVASDAAPAIRVPVSFQVLSEETMRQSREQSSGTAASATKERAPFNRLISGCLSGDKEEVRKALDDGADPNQKFMDQALVAYAGFGGHLEIVKLLVDRGARLADGSGQVLWMYAKLNGHRDVAAFVRQEGIPISVFTHIGLLICRIRQLAKWMKRG